MGARTNARETRDGVLPLPSRVSLARPVLSCARHFLNVCYAGQEAGPQQGFSIPLIPTQNFGQSRNLEGYFWHHASRAYFQSRISPQFRFKIPNPEPQIREIPHPEKLIGDPLGSRLICEFVVQKKRAIYNRIQLRMERSTCPESCGRGVCQTRTRFLTDSCF